MGSNLNFKNLGEMGNFGLTRQSSIYSLTFDEFHSTVGGTGKDFGSMNMDELLKNIWSAEENQNIGSASGGVGNGNLRTQGSLTLPRTLSQRTVDEVWKYISSKDCSKGKDATGNPVGFNLVAKEPTLGEVTLEEFLVRAGAVREDAHLAAEESTNNVCLMNKGFGYQDQQGIISGSNQITGIDQSVNLAMQQQQPQTNLAPYGGIIGVSDSAVMNNNRAMQQGIVGLGTNGSPAVSSDGLAKSKGDKSPIPYVFNGGLRSAALEKVVERRQRRMIKNRESAARSRARKQAYTMELEAEIAKLKEENELLRKKQAIMLEMQKNQVSLDMLNFQIVNRVISNFGDYDRWRRFRTTKVGGRDDEA